MNTSSDGVFTRNAGLPNAPSSLGGHYSMRSFLLLFLKKPISSGSLQKRQAGWFSLSQSADSCNWVFVNY